VELSLFFCDHRFSIGTFVTIPKPKQKYVLIQTSHKKGVDSSSLVLSVVCLALFEVVHLIPCMLFLMLVLKLVRLRRRVILKFDVRKFGIVCVCVFWCVYVCLREPKKASKRKEESSVNSFFFWGKGSIFQMEIIIWLQLIENCAKSQLLYK
jgi:hypothetical protein